MFNFKKLGVAKNPKERTEAAAKEIAEVLKKYNCDIDLKHTIDIYPLDNVKGLQTKNEK